MQKFGIESMLLFQQSTLLLRILPQIRLMKVASAKLKLSLPTILQNSQHMLIPGPTIIIHLFFSKKVGLQAQLILLQAFHQLTN